MSRPVTQAVLLAVLAWPLSPGTLAPCHSLDCSWQFMLEQAAQARLPFGTHVVFSYGPLGFLVVPELFRPVPAMFSLLFTFAVFVALFWVIVWSLRQSVNPVIAFFLAYVAGSTVTFKGVALVPQLGVNLPLHAQLLLLLGLPITLAVLSGPDTEPQTRRWMALGALAAVSSLIVPALAVGFLVLILAALAVNRTEWLRHIRWLVLSALVVGGIAWEATGNSPTNAVSFVTRSAEIASGYSAALALPSHVSAFFLVVNVVDVCVIVAVAFAASRRFTSRAQVATMLATVVMVWLLAKETFVRPDAAHAGFLVAAAPLMVVCYLRFLRARALVVGTLLLTTVLAYVTWTGGPFGSVPQYSSGRVDRAASNLIHEVRDLASPSRRSYITAVARRNIKSTFALPPAMVAKTRGQCVDVDPVDVVVLWAYRRMRPCTLPVFQDYAAYTSGLDRLDADSLARSGAPQEILRRARPPIDTLPFAWDPPLTQLEMECRYRQISATPVWQLTVHTRDRCGPSVLIKQVESAQGHPVAVPHAGSGFVVAATFSLAPSLTWRIQNLVMRPPRFCATTSTAGISSTAQFVLGTASNPHILRPASTLRYSSPFVPPAVDTISVHACGSPPSSSTMTISFYRIRMR